MQEVKLLYGLKNEELVAVDEVDKGLSCGCICPACRKQLIAKKGNINTHHFAHYNSPDCFGGVETVLHQLCKEIISNSITFTTPILYYPNTSYAIFQETEIPVNDVHLEKKLGGIIPDIIIESKGKKLFVEIVVNHPIDEIKFRKITAENIATIAIYAKHLIEGLYLKKDFRLTNESFQKEITHRTKYKRWLYNPRLEKIKARLREEFAKKKNIKSFEGDYDCFRFVENCPLQIHTWRGGRNIGKSYAKIQDCCKCKFSIINEYVHLMDIYCMGHLKDDFHSLIML